MDDTGRVASWWLRSPGANERYAAHVYGDVDDNMDHGDIAVDGNIGVDMDGDESFDGHMNYNNPGYLTHAKGVRPALWLRMS